MCMSIRVEWRDVCRYSLADSRRMRVRVGMSGQVGEVDSMFQALRAEVEALFMTGPSVSLEAVSTELQNTHAHVADEVRSCRPSGRKQDVGLLISRDGQRLLSQLPLLSF